MVPRPQANSSFFVLHSSFTKANIEPFTRATKNRVSVTSKNLLTKSRLRVNKNNTLIFNAKTDVFVRRKRCFSFCGAARAFYICVTPLFLIFFRNKPGLLCAPSGDSGNLTPDK